MFIFILAGNTELGAASVRSSLLTEHCNTGFNFRVNVEHYDWIIPRLYAFH